MSESPGAIMTPKRNCEYYFCPKSKIFSQQGIQQFSTHLFLLPINKQFLVLLGLTPNPISSFRYLTSSLGGQNSWAVLVLFIPLSLGTKIFGLHYSWQWEFSWYKHDHISARNLRYNFASHAWNLLNILVSKFSLHISFSCGKNNFVFILIANPNTTSRAIIFNHKLKLYQGSFQFFC